MKYRAVCPCCQVRLRRRHAFRSGARRCVSCGATLIPTEPANWRGNIVFGVLLLLIALHAAIDISEGGLGLLGDLIAFAAWCVITFALWPYVTPFHATHDNRRFCRKCGYDLRATPDASGPLFDKCPECGVPVQSATDKAKS
jgi:hypothetical protein